MGLWVVLILQNKCFIEETFKRNVLFQKTVERRAVAAGKKLGLNVWFCTLWFSCSGASFKKRRMMADKILDHYYKSFLKKNSFFTNFLSWRMEPYGTGTHMQKRLLIRWVSFCELPQQFFAIRCWRSTTGSQIVCFSVFAETKKLLAIIFYGYQTMDRSHHSVTKKPQWW